MGIPSSVPYFIFTQNRYSTAGWALLETVERAAVAREVFRNYRTRFDRPEFEMVMVKAANPDEAYAELERKAEPVAGGYPDPAAHDPLG